MNIKELWNSQADHQNQWDSLGEDEKLEFAIAHEREECALVALDAPLMCLRQDTREACAEAIRARSKA